MKPPILHPLQVITLRQAILRYRLSRLEAARLQIRLAGRERRMPRGRIGYFVSDIEVVLCPPKAA